MKKTKCVKCMQKKGKRSCKQHNNEFLCPLCCAEFRDIACEGCSYYEEAKKYIATKSEKPEVKHFYAEINEEVENTVDQALAQVERGAIEKGEAIILELKKKHPRNHTVFYGLGVVHALKGQYDEGIKYFDKAIDIFPYFMEAYFNKAVACQKKLDIGNMIRAYQKVIAVGDPNDKCVQQAKSFLFDLEQQIFNDEGVNLEAYLKSMDKFEKAVSYMNNQEWEKAIFYFKECLAITKKHHQSYGNMGICHAKLGRKEDALVAFDKALDIDPNYELAMVNRLMTESLKDGEKLESGRVSSVEYLKEYPMKKRSYIQSVVQQLKKSI